MEFSYVEEVVISDALNKERMLALSEYYRITNTDNVRIIAYINISSYTTMETLKEALMEFKMMHKELGTQYVW